MDRFREAYHLSANTIMERFEHTSGEEWLQIYDAWKLTGVTIPPNKWHEAQIRAVRNLREVPLFTASKKNAVLAIRSDVGRLLGLEEFDTKATGVYTQSALLFISLHTTHETDGTAELGHSVATFEVRLTPYRDLGDCRDLARYHFVYKGLLLPSEDMPSLKDPST